MIIITIILAILAQFLPPPMPMQFWGKVYGALPGMKVSVHGEDQRELTGSFVFLYEGEPVYNVNVLGWHEEYPSGAQDGEVLVLRVNEVYAATYIPGWTEGLSMNLDLTYEAGPTPTPSPTPPITPTSLPTFTPTPTSTPSPTVVPTGAHRFYGQVVGGLDGMPLIVTVIQDDHHITLAETTCFAQDGLTLYTVDVPCDWGDWLYLQVNGRMLWTWTPGCSPGTSTEQTLVYIGGETATPTEVPTATATETPTQTPTPTSTETALLRLIIEAPASSGGENERSLVTVIRGSESMTFSILTEDVGAFVQIILDGREPLEE